LATQRISSSPPHPLGSQERAQGGSFAHSSSKPRHPHPHPQGERKGGPSRQGAEGKAHTAPSFLPHEVGMANLHHPRPRPFPRGTSTRTRYHPTQLPLWTTLKERSTGVEGAGRAASRAAEAGQPRTGVTMTYKGQARAWSGGRKGTGWRGPLSLQWRQQRPLAHLLLERRKPGGGLGGVRLSLTLAGVLRPPRRLLTVPRLPALCL
jgi:hypothetical protein